MAVEVDGLKKLGFAIAGLAPLLFVIVFLATHRSSELGGAAGTMMVLAAIGAIERFHALVDAWKELVRKEPAETETTAERLADIRADEPEAKAVAPERVRVSHTETNEMQPDSDREGQERHSKFSSPKK